MIKSTVNAAIRRMGYTGEEVCVHGFMNMASTIFYKNEFRGEAVEFQLAYV